MDKIKAIVRMNEAPTRPLHLHRIVRPVLNEDGELDFVGVEDIDDAEAKVLAEYQPRLAPKVPTGEIALRKEIRGTPAHAIRSGSTLLPQLRDQIELAFTRMVADYRRMYWADEDRKDAERLIEARRAQQLEDTQVRQQEKEDQNDWDFLYNDGLEDFEI